MQSQQDEQAEPVKVTLERLRNDPLLREDIQHNKIKAERLQTHLQGLWKERRETIIETWRDGCAPEYRKELLSVCHNASQNGNVQN